MLIADIIGVIEEKINTYVTYVGRRRINLNLQLEGLVKHFNNE